MTMELLDRYLNTVRIFLPRAQKNDIIRELSENIRAEMEEREAELGHPLDEAEQAAILKRHGNPMLVAGRYRGERRTLSFGRELIGPELFSLYVRILAVSVAFAVMVTAAFRWALAEPTSLSPLLLPVAIQFIVVTSIFMIVQRCHEKFHLFDRWTTTSLWPPARPQRIPYSQSVAEIIFSCIFLLWWGAVARSPEILFGSNAAGFGLAPVWRSLQVPTLALVLVSIIKASINLVHPDWIRFNAAVRAITSLAVLTLVAKLLVAGTLVVVTNPATSATLNQLVAIGSRSVTVLEIVDASIRLGLAIAAVTSLVDVALAIRKWTRTA